MNPGTAFEPSPEQPRDDQADVARLLYMHQKPLGQRYEGSQETGEPRSFAVPSIEEINRNIAAGNERLRQQLTPKQTAAQLTPEQMRMRDYGDEIARQVGWSGESDAERTARLRAISGK